MNFKRSKCIWTLGLYVGLLHSPAFAGEVVLNPGTLTGTVGFSGTTVQSGIIEAWASDGSGFSAYNNFSGNTYSMSLEGAHTYNTRVRANVDNGTDSWSQWVYRYSGHNILVPVYGTAVDNYQYTTQEVNATITVIAGTLNSSYIYSSANELVGPRSEQYDTQKGTGNAVVHFRQVVDSSVGVWGSAYVTTVGGISLNFNLPTQTVDLTSGPANINWTVDLSGLLPGDIAGLGSMDELVGDPGRVTGHGHWWYNQTYGWNTIYGGQSSNGSYGPVQALFADNWTNWFNYSYFNSPFAYFQWPGMGTVSVPPGGTVNQDFVDGMGYLRGQFLLNGFQNNASYNYGYVYYIGYNGGNHLGYALDYLYPGSDPTGQFNLAVRPGDWTPYYYQFGFSDYSDPLRPLQGYVARYPYSQPATPVADDADVTLPGAPNFTSSHTTTIFVLDVIEAPGNPNILSRYPRIDAWENTASGYRYFGFSGEYSTLVARPVLKLTAEPGTYNATIRATLDNGTEVVFANNVSLVIPSPISTPAGTGVVVNDPASGVTITGNVLAGGSGVSTVTQTSFGPSAPQGFRVTGPGGLSEFYNLDSTALWQFPVTVCVTYDDTGMTLMQENNVHLRHYDTGLSAWIVITTSRNTTTNVVCGLTPGFSPFAVMTPIATSGTYDTDGDGIADWQVDANEVIINQLDNCAEVANPSQSDSDQDNIGDACDTDNDNDGIEDVYDNCPSNPNADQADNDGDEVGNVCDNCPNDFNVDQADGDNDGVGNVCDLGADDDLDGVENGDDLCPETLLDALIDLDGCSSPQRLELYCPPSATWSNHGAYVSCVTDETQDQVDLGLITNAEKGTLVKAAANSNVGKKNGK